MTADCSALKSYGWAHLSSFTPLIGSIESPILVPRPRQQFHHLHSKYKNLFSGSKISLILETKQPMN